MPACLITYLKVTPPGEFPGGAVVRTPRFHCQGARVWGGEILKAERLSPPPKKNKQKKLVVLGDNSHVGTVTHDFKECEKLF